MAADESPATIALVRGCTCLALAAGMLLSPRLWISERSYPLTPVFDGLGPIPFPLDHVVAGSLLGAILSAAVGLRPRVTLSLSLGLCVFLVACDQSRLQPWFYLYMILLGALTAQAWQREAATEATVCLDTCRVAVIGTYLWSGLHKLNVSYLSEGHRWFVGPLVERLPVGAGELVLSAGLLVPTLEIAIACGLLAPRSRSAAVAAAVAMHAFVIVTLSPLGHGWNIVVLPWNVAMAVLVTLLFLRSGGAPTRRIVDPRAGAYHAVVLLLLWIMPAASFAGLWDGYLSASLYSHAQQRGGIRMTAAVRERLPDEIARYLDSEGSLWATDWSMHELGVPAYPERRVFARVARKICEIGGDDDGAELLFARRPHPWTGEFSVEVSTCREL